jgi:hypothetical protein
MTTVLLGQDGVNQVGPSPARLGATLTNIDRTRRESVASSGVC